MTSRDGASRTWFSGGQAARIGPNMSGLPGLSFCGIMGGYYLFQLQMHHVVSYLSQSRKIKRDDSAVDAFGAVVIPYKLI